MSSLVLSINLSDQTKNIQFRSENISITSGDGEQFGSISTSTSEGSITIDTHITGGNGPGLLLLRNLSTTAAETIDIGTATTVYNFTLNANDGSELNWAAIPLKSTITTIYHIAASGTPQLWFQLYERGA
jgi:hypothetical protein